MYHIRRMIDPHPPNKTLDKGNRIVYIWLAPNIVGVFNGEGPPVPIPNTEVKLTSADNTCLETDREDRSMPTRKTVACAAVFLRLMITSGDIAVTLNCDGNTIMGSLLSTDRLMVGLNFSTHPPVGLTQ